MKTQEYLAGSAAILENHLKQVRQQVAEKEGKVTKFSVAWLSGLKPLKAHLHGLFREYGFTQWEDIVALLSAMSGKEVRSKTHRLVKDRDHLLLQKISPSDKEVYVIDKDAPVIKSPLHLSIQTVSKMDKRSKRILYVDKETLNHRLTVRKWQKGDYFYPLGMKGRKKLSKFFKDEKIDILSKEKQWLLCSGNDIVWVIGRRADERFKVTKDTKEILKFTWIE